MRRAGSTIRFTPALAGWLLLDVAGMLLFAAGALFLARGQAFFVWLPATPADAVVMLVAGGVLMLVAAANLLRASLATRGADAAGAAPDGARGPGA